jgi:hypothetical protein
VDLEDDSHRHYRAVSKRQLVFQQAWVYSLSLACGLRASYPSAQSCCVCMTACFSTGLRIIPIGTIVLCLQTACFSTGLGLLFVARLWFSRMIPIGTTVLCLRDSLFFNGLGSSLCHSRVDHEHHTYPSAQSCCVCMTTCFSTGLRLLFVACVRFSSKIPIGTTVLCLRDSLFFNRLGSTLYRSRVDHEHDTHRYNRAVSADGLFFNGLGTALCRSRVDLEYHTHRHHRAVSARQLVSQRVWD